MQGIQFVTAIIMVLVVVVGATVLPYGVLYLARRRQRAGCGSIVVLVVLGGGLGLLLALAVRDSIQAGLAVPQVQAIFDAQCDGGQRVRAGEFQTEPYFAWIGEDGSCHYLDGERRWECYCPGDEDR